MNAEAAIQEETLSFSPARVWVIATNTITEVIRQKVLYVFILFSLVLIGASSFFTQFSFNAEIKSIIDTCLGAIKYLTALIAIVGTAMLLPSEIESRTIYTILTKPVYRIEFLMGKVVGMSVLIFFVTLAMSALFAVVLFMKESSLVAQTLQGSNMAEAQDEVKQTVAAIYSQTRNPNLIKAVALLYAQSVLLVSLTIMISTFATSSLFTIIIMLLVYFCAPLSAIANEVWRAHPSTLASFGLMFINFFIPDLPSMTLVDDVVVGKTVTMAYFWSTTGYAAVYSLVVFGLAAIIFQEKEL
jgi:ABC-type transport system involved in multi-copper enzyme maturation permease subunit